MGATASIVIGARSLGEMYVVAGPVLELWRLLMAGRQGRSGRAVYSTRVACSDSSDVECLGCLVNADRYAGWDELAVTPHATGRSLLSQGMSDSGGTRSVCLGKDISDWYPEVCAQIRVST